VAGGTVRLHNRFPRLSQFRCLNVLVLFKHFYRAMLCTAPTMPSQNVRPSVTRRYSLKTAKHIIKLFSPSSSHTILFFPHQTVWQYYDGGPLTGASKAKGGCEQELSYREQIARHLRTPYVDGIYNNLVTLKCVLAVTKCH